MSDHYYRDPVYEKSDVAKYVTYNNDGGIGIHKTQIDSRGGHHVESGINLSRHETDNLRQVAPSVARDAAAGRDTRYYDLNSGRATDTPGTGPYVYARNSTSHWESQGVNPRVTHDVHVREFQDGRMTRDGGCLDSRNFQHFNNKHLSPSKK